ncbi:hypothetical protein, partial [Xanthomonas oryzae]|uniref:hypothetical protein n=1 Tax=Xanthomonas oryzae TaxID=347 RepID=UPI001C665105
MARKQCLIDPAGEVLEAARLPGSPETHATLSRFPIPDSPPSPTEQRTIVRQMHPQPCRDACDAEVPR